MSEQGQIGSIRAVLRKALLGGMESVWMFLPDGELSPETPCLVLMSDPDDECDERGIPLGAVRQGFPHEGLDGVTLTSVGEWALQFESPPSDSLLFESFAYYLHFDAFLPAPGAPDPPTWAESQARVDAEFLERLGPEDASRPCREEGCVRGSIRLGVLCKRHHFENVFGRSPREV